MISKKLIDFGDIDTKDFCKTGIDFHNVRKYPIEVDWWFEEKERMENGFQVGDWKITGEHYTYLNFCRIKLTDDDSKYSTIKGNQKKQVRKIVKNPDFWDGDYIFYWVKYIARYGLTEEEYLKLKLPIKIKVHEEELADGTTIRKVGGGKNLSVAKKRRFGASYKLGSSGARNYVLRPKSLTVYAAFDNAYLLDDAIMSKLIENINFFDKYTQFGGPRLIDSDDDIQMGYKEEAPGGAWVDEGNLSRVMSVSYGKNTGAVRGKDGEEIYWEESGKAPNLLAATKAALDTTGDGNFISGQHIWFGTGGGENAAWEGFKEIFYNPQTYNCLEIENEWDEGAVNTYCGLFIPDYWNYVGYITRNGESLIDIAKTAEEEYQKITYIDKGDTKGLIERKMEHPFTPMEAFAVSNSTIFDTNMIRKWREEVERSKSYLTMGSVGDLVRLADGNLSFEIKENDPEYIPLFDYPIKKGKKNTGAMIMYHAPKRVDGKVPANMYIIDCDTYRFDYSTGDSVGAVYVKIRNTDLLPYSLSDKLALSYVGRPAKKDDFMKRIYYLAEFYNAKIGFENDEGNSLVDYALRHPKLRLVEYLEPQFDLGYDERLANYNKTRRVYGIAMGSGKNNELIHTGDEYTKEWMEEVRGVREDGSVMLNLHTIHDLGLLREWESYNVNNNKNFDRQAAFRVMMFHNRTVVYKQRKIVASGKLSKFFSREHRFFSAAN